MTATIPPWSRLQATAADVSDRLMELPQDHGFTYKPAGTCDCGIGSAGNGYDTWFADDECPHPNKCLMDRLNRNDTSPTASETTLTRTALPLALTQADVAAELAHALAARGVIVHPNSNKYVLWVYASRPSHDVSKLELREVTRQWLVQQREAAMIERGKMDRLWGTMMTDTESKQFVSLHNALLDRVNALTKLMTLRGIDSLLTLAGGVKVKPTD